MENTLEYIYKQLRKERDKLDSASIKIRKMQCMYLKQFPYLDTLQRDVLCYANATLDSFEESLNSVIKVLEDKLHATESNNEAYVKECLNNIVNSINKNSDMTIKVYSMEELVKDLLNNEANVKEHKCHDDSVEKSNNSINIAIESELKEYLDNEFKSIKGYLLNISKRLTAIEKANGVKDVKPETPCTKEKSVSTTKEVKPKAENVKEKTKTDKVVKSKKATTTKSKKVTENKK